MVLLSDRALWELRNYAAYPGEGSDAPNAYKMRLLLGHIDALEKRLEQAERERDEAIETLAALEERGRDEG
jgi:hypothetical protein